ncbi:MAG TPA: hypothetical protein VM100_03435 [Longimicrobiales bacterium]|nr:hypothetical protein [Longimicrobiales bacterium]
MDLFQDRLDLPDWVFPTCVVLLLVGLPIVVFTALVQVHDFSPAIERNFTWKRSLMYGAVAFLLLALTAGAWVGSRALGIGPGASLVSSGMLGNRDRVLIEPFAAPDEDSTLATMFTETVRISLNQSAKVHVIGQDEVRDALELMKLPGKTKVTGDVAREVSQRLGAKAAVRGGLTRVGNGYLLNLSLVSIGNGESLVAYHETAKDADHLIAAIDVIARRVRKKIGDPLNELRGEPPLAMVTTSSLEALKVFTASRYAGNVEGDLDKSVQLLERAIEIDTTFTAAYQQLGSTLINRGDPPARAVAAITKAFAHRERLPARERAAVEYSYYSYVTGDQDKAIAIQKARFDDGDSTVANSVGLALSRSGRLEEATHYLRIAVDQKRAYQPFSNLAGAYFALNRITAADSVAEALHAFRPNHPRYFRIKATSASSRHEWDSAAAWAGKLASASGPAIQTEGLRFLYSINLIQGKTVRAAEAAEKLARISKQRALDAVVLQAELLRAYAIALAGRKQEARNVLDAALLAHPLTPMAAEDRPYWMLSLLYYVLGDATLASSSAQAGVSAAPGASGRWYVTNLKVLGALARRDAKQALAITADTAVESECGGCKLPMRGWAFELTAQPDSAIAMYEKFLSSYSHPNLQASFLGDTIERLAELYDRKGDKEKAVRYYARLSELWRNADGELLVRAQRAAARIAALNRTSS